jgi:enoyl-CoA hydratase/carnithine racemase
LNARPARISPDRVQDVRWLASSDLERPTPMVFDGDAESWLRAALRPAAAAHMLQSPSATLALVRGAAPPEAASLLAAFDLVATGADSVIEERLAQWVEAFERRPQASSITASVARLAGGSLLSESLAYSTLQSGSEFAEWLAALPRREAEPPGDRIRVDPGDRFAEIVLTRAARHNAFDSVMREQLCDVLDALESDGFHAIALRGEGPSFCSGGDLAEFGRFRDPASSHLVRTGRSVAARFLALGDRIAVAVHGATIGAGIELAAFAARVVAGDDVRISLPEVGFGLLPGSGGTVSIPRRIGRQAFLDLALTGRTINAFEALAMGLVDEVVPLAELPDRLRAEATSLA